jgi:hypothetical protein
MRDATITGRRALRVKPAMLKPSRWRMATCDAMHVAEEEQARASDADARGNGLASADVRTSASATRANSTTAHVTAGGCAGVAAAAGGGTSCGGGAVRAAHEATTAMRNAAADATRAHARAHAGCGIAARSSHARKRALHAHTHAAAAGLWGAAGMVTWRTEERLCGASDAATRACRRTWQAVTSPNAAAMLDTSSLVSRG